MLRLIRPVARHVITLRTHNHTVRGILSPLAAKNAAKWD
jgi:hypothetical protein